MQSRSHLVPCLISLFVIGSLVAGCGKGAVDTTTGAGVATSITLTPSSLSMNAGQVVQMSAVLLDGTGTQLTNTAFTYTASGGAQVSTNGLVCAGTWDSLTNPVICTAGPATGTGTITVTSAGITQTAAVSIHPRIARVTITTTPPALCNSQKETQQYTAHAFDTNNVDITASAGAFTFSSSNTASVTIDANGLATAIQPGAALISASVNGVFSVPQPFKSCQPVSIVLSPATPVSIAVAATSTITITVIDQKGNTIAASGLSLSFISSNPTVASINSSGVITGIGAGGTGIEISCSPPSCNGGANANIPVYSNVVPVTVSGTTASTVYVTGATATSIIPIDTATNIAGAAITIPQNNSVQPTINSFVFDKVSSKAYLGTDKSLLVLDTATNTVNASAIQLAGKVLAVSTDGSEVIYADQSGSPKTYVYKTATDTFTQLSLTTLTTAAAYSPESLKAFLISGGAVWAYSGPLSPPLLRQVVNSTTATDATFLSQGSLGYVSGATANAVNAYSTCDNSLAATVPVPVTPLEIGSSSDATHVFAVDGTSIDDIAVSNIATAPGSNCPATVNNAVTTTSFGVGAFTPKQLLVSSDGTNVLVITGSKVLKYVVATKAVSAITPSTGSAITTGSETLDGQNLYIGMTGTNDVHRISVASGTDAQQIPVTLKDVNSAAVAPDFVVVRPK